MDEFKKGMSMPVPCTLPGYTVSVLPVTLQEVGIFMARFLHQDFTPYPTTRRLWILSAFWITGLLCGVASACYAGPPFLSLMRNAVFCSVSIICLLLTVFLPFLLSALAVFFSVPCFLYPIAFAKAFLLAFVSMGIFITFGSAGWLFRLLIGFGDIVSVPLLIWFWLRCLCADRKTCHFDFMITTSLIFLIICIDFRIISPFLADLINL